MVGVFGTMAADVVHVVLHVPYVVSSLGYGLGLALVFGTWRRLEGSLAVHDVTTLRREVLYWAAVAATFATGTAVGDLSAITWHLGYGGSIVAFAVAICVPAVGYRWWRWDATLAFWAAYVITRPRRLRGRLDRQADRSGGTGLRRRDDEACCLPSQSLSLSRAHKARAYTEAALPAEARPLARHATVLSGWSRLKAPMGGSARTRGEDA